MLNVLLELNEIRYGDVVFGLDVDHLGGWASDATQIVGVLCEEVGSYEDVFQLINVVCLDNDAVQVLDFNIYIY